MDSNTCIIKYSKSDQYSIYLGIKGSDLTPVEKWISKEYEYSKERNSLSTIYIFQALKIQLNSKKLLLASGFSKEEILKKLSLEEEKKPISFSSIIYNDSKRSYIINSKIQDAYLISKYTTTLFKNTNGLLAGFGWFTNVWTRDELICLDYFIELKEFDFVKKRIDHYINQINFQTGLLPRLFIDGSYESIDGIFWLLRVFTKFIEQLIRYEKLDNFYTKNNIKVITQQFNSLYMIIKEKHFNEFITVKQGDSWMDTITVEFPLDIQILFLSFLKHLKFLNQIEQNPIISELEKFEKEFKNKLKKTYYRNACLYDEINYDRLTCNIFLAYYIYPSLFNTKEWETIFDEGLKHLKNSWSGINSLSKNDNNFHCNYTGENNKSYHNGDSWYWISALTAISLYNCNKLKYLKIIDQITLAITKDILQLGTLGFCSEISSSESQKAQGNLAQLWSNIFYLKLIEKIYLDTNN
jgi:glycogen debranching enzyme